MLIHLQTYLNDFTTWFILRSISFKVSSLTQAKRYFVSEKLVLLYYYSTFSSETNLELNPRTSLFHLEQFYLHWTRPGSPRIESFCQSGRWWLWNLHCQQSPSHCNWNLQTSSRYLYEKAKMLLENKINVLLHFCGGT